MLMTSSPWSISYIWAPYLSSIYTPNDRAEGLESGCRLGFCQPPNTDLKMIAMPETMPDTTPAGRVHRDCPSCRTPSSTAAPVRYAHPDWPMVACAHCGLVYLEQVPVYAAL